MLDRRARYSRMVMEDALLELMRSKSYTKITVTELCHRADVNRATFYRHFRDVPDLLDQCQSRIISELLSRKSGFDDDLQGELVDMLDAMRAHAQVYDALLSPNGDPEFPSKLMGRFQDAVRDESNGKYAKLSAHELDWLFLFASRGCAAVIRGWVASGMEEDPSEVAAFLRAAVEGASQLGGRDAFRLHG